jgi:hypothetical protein
MEIPTKCAYPDCENRPLLLAYGKFLCGECFLKIKKRQEDKLWENITNEK